MDFDRLIDEATALLKKRGRLTSAALKRQFDLDEALLADLRDELILAQRVAVDEGQGVLVWNGAPSAPPAGPAALPVLVQAPAERRQITVMFCDLVGSTTLSTRLDPEDLRDVMASYHAVCERVIGRFEGHISQLLGDGVLAYFGYPRAHEDDARRALKSAMAIVPAVHEAASHLRCLAGRGLQVRIGIHTGMVVVGETGNERLAMGETPNIAARLQGLAPLDGVLISAVTRQLLRGGFELLDLGVQALKGIPEPLEVFQVLREIDLDDALDNLSESESQLGMVGRELETRLLQDRWHQALQPQSEGGGGQVVLVCGDPGIGKSRLVRALQNQVAHEGGASLVLRGSSYHRNTALYPVVRRLRHDLRLHTRTSLRDSPDLLSPWLLENGFSEAEALPLFAALLAVPLPGQVQSAPSLSAGQKRQVQDLIVQWLLNRCRHQPLLLVWEDLHWADASSLELIDHLMEEMGNASLLLLLTYRPEFVPPWRHSANRYQLVINRLSPADIEALVLRLTGGKRFPAEVMHQLVLQTDGVPLYVEEVTKLLLESRRLVERNDRYELQGPLAGLNIPATLRDSLMARLDRQSPGREVAQLGATVGREFTQQLIEILWTPATGLLEEGLQQLLDSELLMRRQSGKEVSYMFKHALVQEVAYESLLRRTREEYHACIVQVMKQQFPGLAQRQPEVLAHHHTGAGQLEQAIPCWLAAAERAIETSAHAEAIGHVNKALELLQQLPDSTDRVRSQITLNIRLGVSLTALRGYGAAEVERAYASARELCYLAEAQDLMLPSLYGLWRFYLMRAEYTKAHSLGNELLELAQRFDTQEFLAVGHRALGSSLFYMGELGLARTMMDRVLAAPVELSQRVQAFRYDVVDAWVAACSYRAWTAWLMGDEAQALRYSEEAIATARRLEHPFSRALSLSFAGWMHQFRGDLVALRASAAEAMEVSHEHGFEFWMGWNEALLGWANAIDGDPEQGAQQVADGIRRWTATGSELGKSYFLALQAQALLRAKQFDAAASVLEDALRFVAATHERFWEAELHRQLANWMEAVGRPAPEVMSCREQALEVAQSQNALALVRRCTLSAQRKPE
ncbi:MAG: adenylate/guanylate cyclase domain-containing protein [Burkholderiales bacterium]